MKHFEKPEISQRYDLHRPQVHSDIIRALIQSTRSVSSLNKIADVACGTGHSLAPLLSIAKDVVATDISTEMLVVAKENYPDVTFYQSPAEELPFPNNSLDAIFVGMAFHWFDQPSFLSEAVRTLRGEGYLFIYNISFPGIMFENPMYHEWHTNTYWSKFPNPRRNPTDIKTKLIDQVGLKFIDEINLDLKVYFSQIELRDYLCTQSNIDAAIDSGYSLDQIESWLDNQLSNFMDVNERYAFSYLATGVSVQNASNKWL